MPIQLSDSKGPVSSRKQVLKTTRSLIIQISHFTLVAYKNHKYQIAQFKGVYRDMVEDLMRYWKALIERKVEQNGK